MRAPTADTRVPLSAVKSVVWPAMASDHAALLLALQQQFDETQWWPPQMLADMQSQQLCLLLQHAIATVPWQRQRLHACGIDPQAPFSLTDFRRIPLATRRDVQDHVDAMRTLAPIATHGEARSDFTSGSTGTPLRFRSNDLKQLYWHALTLRDHLWHDRDFSAKFGAIRITSDNARHEHWGFAAGAVFGTGPGVGLGVHADLDRQSAWLLAERPAYLLSYPSNLLALARHTRGRGFDLSFLRAVLTFGEALTEDCRDELDNAWGVSVTDMYSAQEVGCIALQCPVTHNYHVQSESLLVEVLDDQGEPCAPGATGRIVLTDLHNFEMPFVRYDIGDYATVGEPCPCGRGLPTLTAITGRVRNMLMLPDGGRRFPRIGAKALARVGVIRQYQFAQIAPTRIEARLVAERPLDAAEEAHVREVVRGRLGHPFEVSFRYFDTIARAASGKYEDFRCEVPLD